ncbi:hypothetical protein [Cohnella sp. GCM10012308]|uniref:hypothetical protein n=1 Tax=Cohnella sp. GCM10012308 TaxID=3317329 RepID=UPI003619F8BB
MNGKKRLVLIFVLSLSVLSACNQQHDSIPIATKTDAAVNSGTSSTTNAAPEKKKNASLEKINLVLTQLKEIQREQLTKKDLGFQDLYYILEDLEKIRSSLQSLEPDDDATINTYINYFKETDVSFNESLAYLYDQDYAKSSTTARDKDFRELDSFDKTSIKSAANVIDNYAQSVIAWEGFIDPSLMN